MIRNEQNQSVGETYCVWCDKHPHRGHRHPPTAVQGRGSGKRWAGAFLAGIVSRFDKWSGNVFTSGDIAGVSRQILDALSRRIAGASENGFLDIVAIMLLALMLAVLAEPIKLLIVYAGGGL